MEIEVSCTFELAKAVCNHGFFMMAPNRWIPSTKTLVRPLRLPDDNKTTVTVSISQSCPTFISVSILDNDYDNALIPPSHHQHIIDQVRRMLRLSKEEEEAVIAFRRLHAGAANKGFGRLFRNPSLFEDIVKTLLLCACRFEDSLDMAEKLCRLNPKRKRGRRKEREVNFPTAQELLKLDQNTLQSILRFRSGRILDLAKDVTSGKINLDDLENKYSNGDDLYKELKKTKGIGDFVSCNLLMCIGFYHIVPFDSETKRHIKQVHGRENKNKGAMVKDIYDKYAPFQSLAYWFELVEYYESKVGKLALLERSEYKTVSGTILNKRSW